jgi:conjugal transfer/entry exclusion protein
MKRNAWLLDPVSCVAIFLFAEGQNNSSKYQHTGNNQYTEMTGWVCKSKCVTQKAGTASCNPSCSEATGTVVFVSNTGQVLQITNQAKAQPMSGKMCKMKGMVDPNSGSIDIDSMIELRGP